MGSLSGPLFSLTARGSIGGALTYSSWRGIPYVRTLVIPNNPNTVPQQEIRGIFSTLNAMWLRMPTLGRAPWVESAIGQPFTDRNRLIQLNVPALQNDVNMDDFVGSPGVGGAPPPLSMVLDSVGANEINCTFTQPAVPTGWTQEAVIAMIFIDGDPSPLIEISPVAQEDAVDPFTLVAFTGIGLVLHQVRGWNRFLNAEGRTVYSIALAGTILPT